MTASFFDTLWTSLPVPALVIDGQNKIAEINPSGEIFMNASAKSLRGAPVWDKLHVNAPLDEAVTRVRRDSSALFVNTVDVGSGEKPPVQCNVQLTTMVDRPGYILILMEPREIAEKMGRAMQSKTAAKSAIGMAEMLAHEIKNPLAGITGAAQLLSMSLTGDDIELTDLIVEESRRVVKLLEQVEQFGNLRPPIRRAVNLHDVLDRAQKSAAVGFAAHMRIKENFDPSLPSTFADSDQLLQVFLNLLKNAAEASDKNGGTIEIRTFYEMSLRVERPDGSRSAVPLQIEIIDDGPGLPNDLASEVFEPFVSGRENGTGLGLALVSKIIAEHDGWISVTSAPGRTVFRISLPVAPKEQDQ
ncbi:two-component system sensor histidine kinase NtrB [Litoreibacter janthinus]|uniref:histidine kinase n=1 Tax=Litoreibacter janthinus TaxID=670154 RepID=A0A1I6H4T0_9RHOB|nr:ATP-binding protein [Litoreibacter janthinus]SFR49439.1 two-component system, NtrC family, nitrogen regulation sensor histidine kinase GlnL [Litoreibacter janthinus]